MEGIEHPIYLIACRDEWIGAGRGLPKGSIISFGDKKSALEFVRAFAEAEGIPAALCRVVEYQFSGNVSEG